MTQIKVTIYPKKSPGFANVRKATNVNDGLINNLLSKVNYPQKIGDLTGAVIKAKQDNFEYIWHEVSTIKGKGYIREDAFSYSPSNAEIQGDPKKERLKVAAQALQNTAAKLTLLGQRLQKLNASYDKLPAPVKKSLDQIKQGYAQSIKRLQATGLIKINLGASKLSGLGAARELKTMDILRAGTVPIIAHTGDVVRLEGHKEYFIIMDVKPQEIRPGKVIEQEVKLKSTTRNIIVYDSGKNIYPLFNKDNKIFAPSLNGTGINGLGIIPAIPIIYGVILIAGAFSVLAIDRVLKYYAEIRAVDQEASQQMIALDAIEKATKSADPATAKAAVKAAEKIALQSEKSQRKVQEGQKDTDLMSQIKNVVMWGGGALVLMKGLQLASDITNKR